MSERETPYEPTLEAGWRQRIEKQFGRPILFSADCERLAEDIEARTGEHVGVTSVKRWFGFAADGTINIRRSTRNIMARFLGYEGLKEMERDLGVEFIHSAYAPDGDVDVHDLEPETLVHLTWNPNRDVELKYLGDCRFLVTKAANSKLEVEDEIILTHFSKGDKLYVKNIIRGGLNMGWYTAAYDGGIKILEIY